MKFAILATAVAAVFAGKEVKLNLAKVGGKVNAWSESGWRTRDSCVATGVQEHLGTRPC